MNIHSIKYTYKFLASSRASIDLNRLIVCQIEISNNKRARLFSFICTASPIKLFELLLGEKSLLFANKEDGKNRRKLYNTVFNQNSLHHYNADIQDVNESGENLKRSFFVLKMKTILLNFWKVNIFAATCWYLLF